MGIKNYLGYAFRILNKTNHKSLTIRATGNAIVKALILIELVKRRVGDLHQKNRIYSLEIKSEEDSKIPEGMVQEKQKNLENRINRINPITLQLMEKRKNKRETNSVGAETKIMESTKMTKIIISQKKKTKPKRKAKRKRMLLREKITE